MCGMVQEAGKYLFPDEASQTALDDNWEHTQLRVVRGKVTDVRFCHTKLLFYLLFILTHSKFIKFVCFLLLVLSAVPAVSFNLPF